MTRFLISNLIIICFFSCLGCRDKVPKKKSFISNETKIQSEDKEKLEENHNSIRLLIPSLSDNNHLYYHELLETALSEAGYNADLQVVPNLPHKRVLLMLKNDALSLYWLVQSKKMDQQFIPVKNGISNNLIGHRILFIAKGQQQDFDNVNTLNDFRKLNKVGAFGKKWFDAEVWKYNNLKYQEVDGKWRNIYKMLASRYRGIDYFSRGFTEIGQESILNPDLDIEQKLMFIYNRDFRFYLSKSAAHYKLILEKALTKAKKSGLIERLLRKYWSKDLKNLNFDKRTKIYLKLPPNY